MNLEQLERFLAVAKYKNFTKAANSLFLTTPSVSKSISDLELSLGVPLFYRAKRDITLTEYGKILASGAKNIISELNELEETVRSHNQAKAPLVTITHQSFDTCRIVELIQKFSEINPEYEFEIDSAQPGEVMQRVAEGKNDIGVTLYQELKRLKNRGSIRYLTIDHSTLLINMAKTHPLAERKTLTIEDLRGQTMLYADYDNDESRLMLLRDYFDREDGLFGDGIRMLKVKNIETGIMRVLKDGYLLPSLSYSKDLLGDSVVGIPIMDSEGKPIVRKDNDMVVIWDNSNINPAMKEFIRFVMEEHNE